MADDTCVAHLNELPEGFPLVVTVDGHEIVLVRAAGQVYALENQCPHKGGPLGMGEIHGRILTCPWHRFRFDLATGESITNPSLVARTYRLELDGDRVRVPDQVGEAPAAHSDT